MNIMTLVNQIDAGEIVLPAIQRSFVWSEGKIEKLMESIMRGYPIGIILMWETFNDIQYRRFDKIFKNNFRPSFIDNSSHKKLRLVLDGQQRLQSLYIALFGQYQNKYMYFDILSGRDTDDFEEEKYYFYFLDTKQAKQWNDDEIEKAKDDDNEDVSRYHIKVSELLTMDVSEKQKFRKTLSKKLKLKEDDELRLETNLAKLDEVLSKEQNILKSSIIDEDKSVHSKSRQTESDVLEIFVRINRQGTPLSRSDLIFSMLKLNWKESATALPDFVEKINQGNSFELDIDFVIRCLFAVSDLGTKFDIDLLRRKSKLELMQNNFEKCCSAIESSVDYIQRYCWVSSNKAVGGSQNLVPFVYYLYHLPKHDIPHKTISDFRKAFFVFSFTNPFSRYADSRLGKFIREVLKPRLANGVYEFPVEDAIWWVNYWERIGHFDDNFVQNNTHLLLYLVQQDSGAKTHYSLNSRELDHIFPRSILRTKNFDESKINHYANFWILSKGKNINKTNKHPKDYFSDVPANDLKLAFIDTSLLDYRRYNKFIEERSKNLLQKLSSKTGLNENDFSFLYS